VQPVDDTAGLNSTGIGLDIDLRRIRKKVQDSLLTVPRQHR